MREEGNPSSSPPQLLHLGPVTCTGERQVEKKPSGSSTCASHTVTHSQRSDETKEKESAFSGQRLGEAERAGKSWGTRAGQWARRVASSVPSSGWPGSQVVLVTLAVLPGGEEGTVPTDVCPALKHAGEVREPLPHLLPPQLSSAQSDPCTAVLHWGAGAFSATFVALDASLPPLSFPGPACLGPSVAATVLGPRETLSKRTGQARA